MRTRIAAVEQPGLFAGPFPTSFIFPWAVVSSRMLQSGDSKSKNLSMMTRKQHMASWRTREIQADQEHGFCSFPECFL